MHEIGGNVMTDTRTNDGYGNSGRHMRNDGLGSWLLLWAPCIEFWYSLVQVTSIQLVYPKSDLLLNLPSGRFSRGFIMHCYFYYGGQNLLHSFMTSHNCSSCMCQLFLYSLLYILPQLIFLRSAWYPQGLIIVQNSALFLWWERFIIWRGNYQTVRSKAGIWFLTLPWQLGRTVWNSEKDGSGVDDRLRNVALDIRCF